MSAPDVLTPEQSDKIKDCFVTLKREKLSEEGSRALRSLSHEVTGLRAIASNWKQLYDRAREGAPIYVALNSVPDYHGPAPSFRSVHTSLEGAIAALYPNEDQERFRGMFRESSKGTWEGPDGFGMVKKVEVLP